MDQRVYTERLIAMATAVPEVQKDIAPFAATIWQHWNELSATPREATWRRNVAVVLNGRGGALVDPWLAYVVALRDTGCFGFRGAGLETLGALVTRRKDYVQFGLVPLTWVAERRGVFEIDAEQRARIPADRLIAFIFAAVGRAQLLLQKVTNLSALSTLARRIWVALALDGPEAIDFARACIDAGLPLSAIERHDRFSLAVQTALVATALQHE